MQVCAAKFTEASMISGLFFFNKTTNKNIELALPTKSKT